jgi:hypothetical protein
VKYIAVVIFISLRDTVHDTNCVGLRPWRDHWGLLRAVLGAALTSYLVGRCGSASMPELTR